MNLNNVFVADIETDGLLNKLTKLHVFSFAHKYGGEEWKIMSTPDLEVVRKAFTNPDNVFVMHNGRRFDAPAVEKLIGEKVQATIIDSLALAWWLYPNRTKKYGLEYFGEDYGVPKPVVEDWEGLTYEEYKHRCEEDVKINIKLWEDLLDKGRKIFMSDDKLSRLINILNFIMDCSHNQEVNMAKVDIDKTKENLARFELMKEEKLEQLISAMPKDTKIVTKKKPAKMYKADGTLSSAGIKWEELKKKEGVEGDVEEIEVIVPTGKEPNPNSVKQKKDWLYSLGWKPTTFKYNRDKKTGVVTKVEQIVDPDSKMLCESVLDLVEKEPAIEALDGLTVLTHRIGVLKGFLKNMDEDGYIPQGLIQLAVTMRWQHSNIVNIPKVTGKGDIRDGKWLRECLVAPEGKRLVQADLSGIESRTSDHYTFKLNPERIEKTKQPFFDAHTEISVVANLMTIEEESFYVFNSAKKDLESAGEDSSHLDYKNFSIYPYNEEIQRMHDLPESEKKVLMQDIKNKRSKGKTTNYASLYLVGAKTLARNLGISIPEAQGLIDAYWDVHWAVKEATKSFRTKKVGDETWIYNPVSGFWYYLRNEKDKFSVINQSTAVYCFNMWVYFVTKRIGFPVTQTHDDLMLIVEDKEEVVEETMFQVKEAMEDVNKALKLNVKLDCEVQNGFTFADTH